MKLFPLVMLITDRKRTCILSRVFSGDEPPEHRQLRSDVEDVVSKPRKNNLHETGSFSFNW